MSITIADRTIFGRNLIAKQYGLTLSEQDRKSVLFFLFNVFFPTSGRTEMLIFGMTKLFLEVLLSTFFLHVFGTAKDGIVLV